MTQVSQVPRCTLILGNVDEAAQHVLCLLRHYVSDYLFLSVDIPVYLQQTLLNSDLIVRPCVQEEHIGRHSSHSDWSSATSPKSSNVISIFCRCSESVNPGLSWSAMLSLFIFWEPCQCLLGRTTLIGWS